MIAGLTLLAGGVVLYGFAGSALSRYTERDHHSGHRTLRLLLLTFGAALAVACLIDGISVVDSQLALRALGLLAAVWVAPAVLLAGALVVFAVFSPPAGGDGGGGSGPDDLPPPPDPDGPDGWAEFERQFRAYAGARDARRSTQLLR